MHPVLQFIFDNGYALEIFLAVYGFAFFFGLRRLAVLRGAGIFVLLVCVSMPFARVTSPWLYWLRYFIIFVIAGGGTLFCTKVSAWNALYCTVGGIATQHLYYRVLSLILSFTPFDYESIFRMAITVPVFCIVYGGIFLLFRKPLKDSAKGGYKLTNKVVIFLALIILIVAMILHLFETQYDFIHTDRSLLSAFSAYGTMCSIFTLGLLYSLFMNSELKVEKAVLEQLVEKQKEQYEHSKETIDIINIKCHDMKQQISRLESRVEQDALDEIKSLIKVYETTYRTGNEVLDVFLSERSLIFERNKVQFDCIVDGECLAFLKPSEIYALFGNAFDNALEALLRLPEDDRMFALAVRTKQGMIVIHMENAYHSDLVFENGLPKTTKEDLTSHGFGMRSIRMVVEKYHGSMTVRAEDGVFNLNILLPSK